MPCGAGKRRERRRAGLLLAAGRSRTRRCATCIFRAATARGPALCWQGRRVLRRAAALPAEIGRLPPGADWRIAFLGRLFARLPRCGNVCRGGGRLSGPGGDCAVRRNAERHAPGPGAPPVRDNAGGPAAAGLRWRKDFLEDYTGRGGQPGAGGAGAVRWKQQLMRGSVHMATLFLGNDIQRVRQPWPAGFPAGGGLAGDGGQALPCRWKARARRPWYTSLCTVISSLFTNRLVARLGTGRTTLFSVAFTAAALTGIAFAPSFYLAVRAGRSAGAGGGRGGCSAEQLCGPALCGAPYELAALLLGPWGHAGACYPLGVSAQAGRLALWLRRSGCAAVVPGAGAGGHPPAVGPL